MDHPAHGLESLMLLVQGSKKKVRKQFNLLKDILWVKD